MAERRMFAKQIIDSDVFLDMPLSTQALYFHLSMRADDDGFVNNPRKIQRMIGASDDDIKILISKRYILTFDSGIIVIKHWKIHNYIQSDRYKSTTYIEEKSQLTLDEKKSYIEKNNQCIQDVYIMDTQVSIGKDSIDKNNIEKEYKEKEKTIDDLLKLQPNELQSNLKEFLKMRKSIKKPMTTRAFELLLKDLDKLANDNETKNKILEQSILHSWQGVFALKDNQANKEQKEKEDLKSYYTERVKSIMNGGYYD